MDALNCHFQPHTTPHTLPTPDTKLYPSPTNPHARLHESHTTVLAKNPVLISTKSARTEQTLTPQIVLAVPLAPLNKEKSASDASTQI
jgi:hypothetical protein